MLSKIASWFPMLLVATFAIAAYWLTHRFQTENNWSAALTHEPDYIVHQFRVRRFDDAGFLADTLYGKTIVHYADDSTAQITSPSIFHQKNPNQPTYEITAEQGAVNQTTREIELMKNVNIVQKQKGQPDLTAQTPYVRYNDKTGLITAWQGVTLHQELTHLAANQLTIDTRQDTVHLKGNVNGAFYPREGAQP